MLLPGMFPWSSSKLSRWCAVESIAGFKHRCCCLSINPLSLIYVCMLFPFPATCPRGLPGAASECLLIGLSLWSVSFVTFSLVLGQLADEVLLGGQRVVPRRLESADFAFAHLDIADALRWSLEDQKLEKEKASIVFAEERQAALLQEWKEEQPEALERLSAAAEAVNRQQLELRKQLQESEHLLETRRQEQVLKRHQSKVQQLLQRRESARSEDGSKEPTADAGNEDGNGAKQVEPAAL